MNSIRLSLWAPVAAYMALIFALSSISQPPDLPSGVSDKGGHAVLYFGLGVLLVRAFAGGWRQPVTASIAVAAMAVAVAYAVTDEIHQYFVPPRQMEALDVAADAAGAAAAIGLFWVRDIIRGRHAL